MLAAVLDTCVIYSGLRRDLLLSLAAVGVFHVVLTEDILFEINYVEAGKLQEGGLDAEAAQIAEREASALHVCGSELTGVSSGDKLLRLRGDLGERGVAYIADDGDEQARLSVHSDAEMDAFGEQEMILCPRGGEHGMLPQGGCGEFDKDVVDGGDRVLER